jgi:hypothetical protein
MSNPNRQNASNPSFIKSLKELSTKVTKGARRHPLWTALGFAATVAGGTLSMRAMIVGDVEGKVAVLESLLATQVSAGDALRRRADELALRVQTLEQGVTRQALQTQGLEQRLAAVEAEQSVQGGQVKTAVAALYDLRSGSRYLPELHLGQLTIVDPTNHNRTLADLHADENGDAGLLISDRNGRARVQLGIGAKADGATYAELMLFDGNTGTARHHLFAGSDRVASQLIRSEHGLDVFNVRSDASQPVSMTMGDIHGTGGLILKFGDLGGSDPRTGLMVLDQDCRDAFVAGRKGNKFEAEMLRDVPVKKKFSEPATSTPPVESPPPVQKKK